MGAAAVILTYSTAVRAVKSAVQKCTSEGLLIRRPVLLWRMSSSGETLLTQACLLVCECTHVHRRYGEVFPLADGTSSEETRKLRQRLGGVKASNATPLSHDCHMIIT